MALTKPILDNVSTFDARYRQTFNFEVVGGDPIVANSLVIKNQQTNDIIYNQKQEVYTTRHELPARALLNDGYYSAYVITYDKDGNVSTPSDSIQFRCYTTPTWEFTNIPERGFIESGSYTFDLKYEQFEGEKIVNYTCYLYSEDKRIISSERFIVGMPPISTSWVGDWEVDGLVSREVYYISAECETEHGMKVDTGLIRLFIAYDLAPNFTLVETKNYCEGGYVGITTTAESIKGHSYPDPLAYIYDNTAAYLNVANAYITWDENLFIQGDYRLIIWGKDFTTDYQPTPDMFSVQINDDDGGSIHVMVHEDNSHDLTLVGTIIKDNTEIIDTIYSNSISPQSVFQTQQIIITKIDGVYSLDYVIAQDYFDSATLGTGILGMMILGQS